jgi:hypothetical protein
MSNATKPLVIDEAIPFRTLKVFRNGTPSDYNGPRQADGIISYMIKQVALHFFCFFVADV